MFEKSKNSVDNSRDATPMSAGGSGRGAVIGPSVKIVGQISCAEDLLIEGAVEGMVRKVEGKGCRCASAGARVAAAARVAVT